MSESSKNTLMAWDVVMGLVLFVAGTGFALLSLTYTTGDAWYLAPGMPPFVVFGSLAIMGLVLTITSCPRHNMALLKEGLRQAFSLSHLPKIKQSLFLLALLAIYYTVLPLFLPFELSTVLYLIVTFRLLWKTASWPRILILSVLVTAMFSVVFSHFFKVLLPGVEWDAFLHLQ